MALSATGSSAQTTVASRSHGLTTGFYDDTAFTSDGPLWFARAAASGASVVRAGGSWSAIAPHQPSDPTNPADPAYQWAALDLEVKQATAAGLSPFISINDAPRWAQAQPIPTSSAPGAWKPNAADYRLFAQALATRYSGRFPDPLQPGMMLPHVRYFEAWNEPNLWLYLAPQWTRVHGAWVAESPLIYRALLNAFYAGVKGGPARRCRRQRGNRAVR